MGWFKPRPDDPEFPVDEPDPDGDTDESEHADKVVPPGFVPPKEEA